MRRRSVFHYSRSNLMGYADVSYKRLNTYRFRLTDRVFPALSARIVRRATAACPPPCFHHNSQMPPLACDLRPFALQFMPFYAAIHGLSHDILRHIATRNANQLKINGLSENIIYICGVGTTLTAKNKMTMAKKQTRKEGRRRHGGAGPQERKKTLTWSKSASCCSSTTKTTQATA